MSSRIPNVDVLQQRGATHSARIHALEDAVRSVKLQNDALKGELTRRGDISESQYENDYDKMNYRQKQMYYPASPPGQGQSLSPRRGYGYEQGQGQSPRRGYGYDEGQGQNSYRDGLRENGVQYSNDSRQGQFRGRPLPENEQHRVSHAVGQMGGREYWGFNEFYKPEFATSYRRGQAQMELAKGSGQQTQYADDYNRIQEQLRRQSEEWEQKRRAEEEMFLKDVNKFFHDSKYLEYRPKTDYDRYPNASVPFKLNPGTALSTYEASYLSPRMPKNQRPSPGGLYIIRFHDNGYDDVRRELRSEQTIMHSYNGFTVGIARNHNILVLSGDAEWTPARKLKPRPNLDVPHRCVDDAVAVLSFPSTDKAEDFCNHTFRNRFREMDFPTPQSSEIYYLPMNTPLYQMSELDTFLFVDLLNVTRKYTDEALQRFESDTRDRMLQVNPNCIPFIVSTKLTGREQLKTGARGVMFKPHSKLYVSRFNSLFDVFDMWKSGVIQKGLNECGLNGPLNVYVIALKDFTD